MNDIKQINSCFHDALIQDALIRVVRSFGVMSVLLFVFISCASAAQTQETQGQSVKVEYDPQKDITQITLNPVILVSRKFEELRLGALTSYKGKVKVEPKEVALIFISLSATDTNKYESTRQLTILADEQRFPLGETQRSKQAQNGLFIESMSAIVPFDVFLRVGRAKDVTVKLGLTTVKLSTQQITLLRAAASYMAQ
jgi:hypothetical protein